MKRYNESIFILKEKLPFLMYKSKLGDYNEQFPICMFLWTKNKNFNKNNLFGLDKNK